MSVENRLEQFIRDTKIGLADEVNGFFQVQVTRIGGPLQHAERTQNWNAATCRCNAPLIVVDQQDFSIQLTRQTYRGFFTCINVGDGLHILRFLYDEPSGGGAEMNSRTLS
jgi:hypothetical protein